MKIAFAAAPFGKAGSDNFNQIGETQPNGTVQWAATSVEGVVPVNPQTVLSVQPSGAYETRPLGMAGEFEVLKFSGGSLTIQPNASGNHPGPMVAYVIAARAL